MKNVVVYLTLLLSIGFSAHSQGYFPFPDSEAIWNQYSINSQNTPYVSYRYRLGVIGDTIINATEYSKVYQLDEFLEATEYVGAIREENKKVFAITQYLGEPEILLYDFDVEIGDIVYSNSPEGYMSMPVEILDIDTIVLLDGTSRNRILTNMGDYWIEGIGSLLGLFIPITPQPLNWESPRLKCFRHFDIDVFIDEYSSGLTCESCFCILETASLESNSVISVFPNPFSNEFNIKTDITGDLDIRIYNSYGIIIKQCDKLVSNRISLENYAKGIYFLKVTNNEKQYSKKIIKK